MLKLFIMMVLEIAIWGSWQVQIFNYMPMLGFEGWQQNLAGSMFAIASVVGIFFSDEFPRLRQLKGPHAIRNRSHGGDHRLDRRCMAFRFPPRRAVNRRPNAIHL